jgi:AraC-like DNA-binding protein
MTMQASVRMAFLQLLLFLIEKWPQKEDALSLGRAELEGLKPALDAGRTARRLITAEEAASLCGLSVNGFNNKFRRQMGCSFAEWALRRRFGGAARALTSTDAPVSDIAADWGFTDASHLHRVLQRFTGCTPRQYRQRYAAGYPSPPGRQRGYE